MSDGAIVLEAADAYRVQALIARIELRNRELVDIVAKRDADAAELRAIATRYGVPTDRDVLVACEASDPHPLGTVYDAKTGEAISRSPRT